MSLPPIPPILDAPRVASVTAIVGVPLNSIAVPFPVFGEQEDLTVTVAGAVLASNLWTFTSSSGTSLNLLPLPITDGVVTFTPALNVTVPTIVSVSGSWQPRQLIVPSAPGISRREFEQTVSTLIASNRELLTMIENEVARAEAAESALAAAIATGSPIPLPTTLPAQPGIWWNDGGVVAIS